MLCIYKNNLNEQICVYYNNIPINSYVTGQVYLPRCDKIIVSSCQWHLEGMGIK